MNKFKNLMIVIWFLVFSSFLTVDAYDLLLESGEFSFAFKPLYCFGNPDEATGEIPYFNAGIFEIKFAILRNLELYGAYEGYNPGTESSESYQKLGITFYLAKGENFGMSINAENLIPSDSITPYTVTGEIVFKGKLF